jgi:hypothetical protein
MIEISVGEAGRTYMRDVLSQCTGAASLLAPVVSKAGRIFAPLPSEASETRALKFELGGLSSQSGALNWLYEDLKSKPFGTFIVQDIWARPSNLRDHQPKHETFITDDAQVYHYLESEALSFDKLVTLHRQISSFQLVGFYINASLNLSEEQRRRHEVPPGYVDQFVKFAIAVYLSAYDQEAWLVWKPAN